MKRSDGLSSLIAELESDRSDLDELFGKWELISTKIAKIDPDEFDWAALGYTIHNLYNVMENYFLRIAKFFENTIDQMTWHKSLVDRMSLDIKEIRPALLKKQDLILFHELRGFRHVFRNIYQNRLDEDRLQLISKKVPTAVAVFSERHDEFIEKLRQIAEHLKE
jgi:hypothetical protein